MDPVNQWAELRIILPLISFQNPLLPSARPMAHARPMAMKAIQRILAVMTGE
jgi:hypothetical protein